MSQDNERAEVAQPENKKTPAGGIRPLRVAALVVAILLLGLMAYALPKLRAAQNNPLVRHFMANAPQMKEMMDLTLSQIEQQGAPATATELIASPYGYDGRYVVATGLVSDEQSAMVAQQAAVSCFDEQSNYHAYVLDDGLVVVDVSGEGPERLSDGTEMKAYGKVIVARMADVFALPWVGPDLKREFANSGMSEKVVFLIARGVQTGSEPAVADNAGADEQHGDTQQVAGGSKLASF